MPQALLIPLADPEWLEVLRVEASKPGRSKQAIAEELGVSRPAISLLVAGKYTARLDKVGAKLAPKILSLYAERVWCPHLRSSISGADCTDHRSAPMTMSDPAKLKHWAACKSCPRNVGETR